jgi:type IV fimbrial biogenesis protein FimT
MSRSGQRGMSLIELMITLTIVGIVILLGIPSFQQWVLNTRIRTITESIQNGLRLARAEASQRGTYVRFQLDSASQWEVCALPASAASAASYTSCTGTSATLLQSFDSPGAGSVVQVGATTATANLASNKYAGNIISGGIPAGINFDALGRPSDYGVSSILRIDVTAAETSLQSASRTLVTTISSGGMVNMCDPAITFSTTTTEGCP